MTQRWYVAGPMTGLPELNYPAFHAAAAQLRAQGHHVENPAENPIPLLHDDATPEELWQAYMRLALAQIVTCSHVLFLSGWEHSKGARIERRVAKWLGITIVEAQP